MPKERYSPKRTRRRAKRASALGPERMVRERDGEVEVLECGHSMAAVVINGRYGEQWRRCVACKEEKEGVKDE